MDNGRKGAIFSSNPELDDNLNTENWQESLKEAVPAGLPTPEQILPKTETVEESTETPKDTMSDTPTEPIPTPTEEPSLGQIVQFPTSKNQAQDKVVPFNPKNIKTNGDYLSPAAIIEIDKLKEKLNQDGDLNSFYNDTRDLTEVNLDNSYQRKLYQQEEKIIPIDSLRQERKAA